MSRGHSRAQKRRRRERWTLEDAAPHLFRPLAIPHWGDDGTFHAVPVKAPPGAIIATASYTFEAEADE